jgi:hypothetical protein
MTYGDSLYYISEGADDTKVPSVDETKADRFVTLSQASLREL